MTRSNSLSVALTLLAAFAVVPSVHAVTVDVTTVGNPSFSVGGFSMFAAEVGTEAGGFAEFFQLSESILPSPNHQHFDAVGVGPGAAHAGPYDAELVSGVSNAGLTDTTTFSESDFRNGRAVNIAFMVFADGDATGSSPDSTSGPIIANATFPITISGETRHDGEPFSEAGSFQVPAVTEIDPQFADLEGISHFPVFFFENADFALDPEAPLAGNYQLRVGLRDSGGAGYDVVAAYTISGGTAVIPLPAALGPGLALLVSLPIVRRFGLGRRGQ